MTGMLTWLRIAGAFNEKLVIENIQDASNNQVITVKALVKPTTNFFVRSMSMDFGVAVLGMRSKRCQLIVSNTTNQRRLYEVKLDDDATGYVPYRGRPSVPT
jgi:peroxiredoxin